MARRLPPPLPPRQPSTTSSAHLPFDPPPGYSSLALDTLTLNSNLSHPSSDPRRSSTESLLPTAAAAASATTPYPTRRRLLLIYIHGFMGNETSFRSFPAHVHHRLTVTLAPTHVVHTKLYPRYRSKRNITFARDDLSRWLEPHEDANTDIVLLGHSMGGLLAAEVVLMPSPTSSPHKPFKHRILGTINFDVPFLGMHPGVVKSGLASIFNPPDEPSDDPSPVTTPAPIPNTPSDPNYNPAFPNDVILPTRKGWRNAWHFVHKHSGELRKATKQLVSSHMEFGGAMANYGELGRRYTRIRALEEGEAGGRVRFVNFYTASTGRGKSGEQGGEGAGDEGMDGEPRAEDRPGDSGNEIAVLEERQREARRGSGDEDSGDKAVALTLLDPSPVPDDEADDYETAAYVSARDPSPPSSPTTPTPSTLSPPPTRSQPENIPPLPALPPPPPPLNIAFIQDPATKKVIEKEHKRAVKLYEKAVKEHEKAAKAQAKGERRKASAAGKEREKPKEGPPRELTHTEREAQRLEQERLRMEAEGRRMRGEASPPRSPPSAPPEEEPPDPPISTPSDFSTLSATTSSSSSSQAPDPDTSPSSPSLYPSPPTPKPHKRPKPSKPRTFCLLPPPDSQGAQDPVWVRVLMPGVDEVGAHCGLFFVDARGRYEGLVGDVVRVVGGWVGDE
ncbi:hypothetical protein B0A50_01933 [Salinomyces thailandicus]|uniref:AB hydrolase-1 domain-containing protein n=1 Tax=Salinomyces thailandicus TaxID=706561 RepID=A0A4U0U9N0_9PEZI|nr:hypothetical protein B0A50_01933 [Salinomyces thailandica]